MEIDAWTRGGWVDLDYSTGAAPPGPVGWRLVAGGAGALPQPRQLLRAEVPVGDAAGARVAVHGGEAVPEAVPRRPQRVLGVHLQLPGEADHRQEQVPHLVE